MIRITTHGLLTAWVLLAICGCDSSKKPEEQSQPQPAVTNDAAAAYRSNPNGKDLYAVLNKMVQNGDTIEKVRGLLGPGEPGDEQLVETTERFAAKHPGSYPQGVQRTDTLIGYQVDSSIRIFLQFRDGKLINHSPSDFAEYQPMTGATASQPETTATAPSSSQPHTATTAGG